MQNFLYKYEKLEDNMVSELELVYISGDMGFPMVYSNTAYKVEMEKTQPHNFSSFRLIPVSHNSAFQNSLKHFHISACFS